MDIETKINIIKSFAAEIVTEEELGNLFASNEHPVAYDGFEPSGIAPVHFGVYRAKIIKKMLGIGIKFKLYLADYFAYLNNKMGGNIDNIRTVGKYFVEVWKAAGIDTSKVEIIWSKDLISDPSYWERVMKISKVIPLDRVKRAITIMGRKEGDNISAGQMFYPIMQVTDIFQMDIDICQLGIDQRKANMLAREVAQKFGWKVPVVISHPLLISLRGMPPDLKASDESVLMQYKMSKSDPKNSIFVHDTYEQIRQKVNGAYCPERITEGNPMIDYLEKMIIDDKTAPITIERPQKFGGNIELKDFNELLTFYREGKIHPADLKDFVAKSLENEIKPIREHFENDSEAKALYEKVKTFEITR